MNSLFEFSKILSIKSHKKSTGHNILLSAFLETTEKTILALFCDNGYLLFHYTNNTASKPVIRQLQWYGHRGKLIKAMCFDPNGNWLLLATADSTLYIFPIFSFMDHTVKINPLWKTDDLTEIKLSGQRAMPTSIKWWETLQGQHVAIIGNEHGEISFINMKTQKEIGGTYITVGINRLDLLHDDQHNTTYLLITANNEHQWHLMLEDKRTEFYWLINQEINSMADRKLHGDKSSSSSSSEDKSPELRPNRLSKFESGIFLTPQNVSGHNLVSAYSLSSNRLQILDGGLEHMHLFSYQLPINCKHIILTDKLIFIIQLIENGNDKTYKLLLLSRKFAEATSDHSKKKEAVEAEIQSFILNSDIVAFYKKSCSSWRKEKLKNEARQEVPTFNGKDTDEISIKTDISVYKSSQLSNKLRSKSNLSLPTELILDGCLIILKDSVWECRLKILPEKLFLSLTDTPSNLPQAEKLGVMIGLDIHRLYEIAADLQLANGQFAQAVHLYQLSKCSQLKRVAYFMNYGYLSELIAYIQVLFSTKSVEIPTPDKVHFANIALHCFVQQITEKCLERPAVYQAFRKFLQENIFYDDEVAIRLLSQEGLFDLLYFCSEIRCQFGLMVEFLLSTNSIKDSLDLLAYNVLMENNYGKLLLFSENENYLHCITSSKILQFLACKPKLLYKHIQFLAQILPDLKVKFLNQIAELYDPSQPVSRLVMRSVHLLRNRYWTSDSICSLTSDVTEWNHAEEDISEEDILKFFIFILLMLIHKRGKNHFDIYLLTDDITDFYQNQHFDLPHFKDNQIQSTLLPFVPLSCGFAHVAFARNGNVYTWGKSLHGRLGHGDPSQEYASPTCVTYFETLKVKVSSVACGALHTIVLTDCGVFSWGSSRFGQLGIGNIQRSCHPVFIETLAKEEIVSVACGQYHSLALSKDGRVFTWGWGVHGQLGHGKPEDSHYPQVVQAVLDKPMLIICGGQGHSAILSHKGEVYTFGSGLFGQLGTGVLTKQSLPQKVELAESIKLISSNYFHTIAVSTTNKVYIWGCNPQALRLQAQCSRRARLQTSASESSNQSHLNRQHNNSSQTPHSSLNQNHILPSVVNTSQITCNIIQVSCGSHHSALLTSDGEVFVWGRNTDGQLGNGTRKEQKLPSMVLAINDRKIVSIACGSDFTIVLDSVGKLWGWGQNDSGQLGQKPSQDSTSRTQGSASNRVITIRTNRRMITITQGCRQGILRPVQINTFAGFQGQSVMDWESGSFENDMALYQIIYYQTRNNQTNICLPALSKLDDPPYGSRALHATLKIFHRSCDFTATLNRCLAFHQFQAAAELCQLEGLFAQAVQYQLKGLRQSVQNINNLSLVTLEIIQYYTRMLDQDNFDVNKQFLEHVITFWMDHELPIEQIESFFLKYPNLFYYPLGLLLFCNTVNKETVSIIQNFLSKLSTKFCLTMVSAIIKHVQSGQQHTELMDYMMELTGTATMLQQIHMVDRWEGPVPTHCLWQEIFHNLQKSALSNCSIHLSSNDVERLSKSLLSERIGAHVSTSCSKDVIIFTCGHHYTTQNFKSIILPYFKESLHMLPQTSKQLLARYQADGAIPAACPRCVVTEIKSEL